MNLKRPFFPKFLSKAEHRFLLKQPEIWSTRVHLVLYYGLLFIVCLTALAFVVPMDPREPSDSDYWRLFLIAVSIIFFTFWLIYLLRFNVFKRFGRISRLKTLVVYLCYFISAAIIISINYVQPYIESVRTNITYGSGELVDDINNMNIAISRLEHDSLDNRWATDTILITSGSNEYWRSNSLIKMGRIYFQENESNADSLVKISDSMYLKYASPKYTFVDPYNLSEIRRGRLLNSADIYRKYLVNYRPDSERGALKKQLDGLLNKYLVNVDTVNYYDYSREEIPSKFSDPNRKYFLGTVEKSLSNIIDKKYRWSEDRLPIYTSVAYYLSLIISLLVFVFRHSTTKTFFLSLLAAVIISILTGLLMAFMRSGDDPFYGLCIFYTLLFFAISLFTWRSRVRSVFQGIALNLFTFLVPFLPVMITAYFLSHVRYENESYYVRFAQYGGGLLLLILIILYLHSAYRRWYSLPEE